MSTQKRRGGFSVLKIDEVYDDGTTVSIGADPLNGLTMSIDGSFFDNFSTDFIEGLISVARKARFYRYSEDEE